jgi:uncharacterized Zn finger protein
MTWFSEGDLLALAGASSFARGERYVEHVLDVRRARSGFVASVTGSEAEPYSVRLSYEHGELSGSCDCPFGDSGAFCKHCVAVGLVVLGGAGEAGSGAAELAAADERVRAYLEGRDRRALVELVWEQAGKDEGLYHRLALRAARDGGVPADVTWVDGLLDAGARGRGFAGYRGGLDYAERTTSVLSELAQLVSDGGAATAVPLLRRAVEQIVAALDHVDDAAGTVADALADAVSLHVQACSLAPPDADELARWLFNLRLDSPDQGALGIEVYQGALGDKGMVVYRALVLDAWERQPATRAAAEDDRADGAVESDEDRRHRAVSGMMEELAVLDGDTAALVRVLARSTQSGWDHLRIATALERAGRDAEALDWARRGVEATWDRPDPRLLDFVAAALQRTGRHADVLDLRREAFRRHPSLAGYTALRAAAEHVSVWPRERVRALGLLQNPEPDPRGRVHASDVDGLPVSHGRNAALVDVLLLEGADDAAWAAAHAGGCMPATWRTLIERRASTHPSDTIPIYKRHVEEAVDRSMQDGYRHAADLVEQLRDQFERAGPPGAMVAYIQRLKAQHARKRMFLAELDSRGL